MRVLLLAALVACANPQPGSGDGDVVGPFTGETHRFAIDRFDLPGNSTEAKLEGDDLTGDGTVDNQVGALIASLIIDKDLAPNPQDLSATGLLPTTIEIQANNLFNDDHVGVSYVGRPGDSAIPVGGTFDAGTFISNRTAISTHSAEGSLVLPIFIDADPTEFPLDHGELDLVSDNLGGYTGQLRGLIHSDVAIHQAAISIYQMLLANPAQHLGFELLLRLTTPLSVDAIEHSSLLQSVLEPDVRLGGETWISIGFQFHMSPCDSGSCMPTQVIDHCDDRVRDSDETDIDCGGSCHACGFSTKCAIDADCQTGHCDSGACREPTCTDGVKNGYEGDVDCGGECGGCPGESCTANDQCASGHCALSAGECS